MRGEQALRIGAVAALLFCNLDIAWVVAADTGGRTCACRCCASELSPAGVCLTRLISYPGLVEANYAQCTEDTLSGTEYCNAKCQEAMGNLCQGRMTGTCVRTALPQSVIDEIRRRLTEQLKKLEDQQRSPAAPK